MDELHFVYYLFYKSVFLCQKYVQHTLYFLSFSLLVAFKNRRIHIQYGRLFELHFRAFRNLANLTFQVINV